jgi:RNA polymerase subunit RPABC4/transcription elongation factor Spt4
VSTKGCPHCGNILPDDSRSCGCGFSFSADGPEVLGAEAARARSDDTLGRQPAPPAKRSGEPRSGKKTKGAGSEKPRSHRSSEAAPDPSRLMECPHCSALISRRAKECPKCEREPFLDCQICGASIVAGSPVCPECGDPDPFNP